MTLKNIGPAPLTIDKNNSLVDLQSPNSNEVSATPQAAPVAPAVSLSPTSLSFGTTKGGQKVGTTSAPQTVTLTNTGTATLNITKISPGGASPTSFAISATTCGTTLAAKASCSISITFTPWPRAP